MPFQAVPNCAEVTIHAEQAGQPIVNTFYFTQGGAWGQSELDELTLTAATAFASEFLPLLNGGYAFQQCIGRDLRTENAIVSIDTTGAGTGGAGGSTVPNNAAFALSRRSAFTGRSARGRVFIAGIPDSAIDTLTRVTSTFANALVEAYDQFENDIALTGWTEVVVSRYHDHVKRGTAVTFAVAFHNYTDLNIDSQRNRLAGRN